MERRTRIPLTLLALTFPLASAQDPTNPPPPSSTDNAIPSHTDTAGQPNDGTSNTGGLYSYYLIFIALIVCAAGVAGYLTYKRKKKHIAYMQQNRDSALDRDLHTWDPMIRARRRYWQGRWRSADMGHEEGLNEHGEAPPPYMPKTRDEEARLGSTSNELAVPMQTLSREQAGLKPPDYTERSVTPGNEGRASSVSMADSPNQPGASQSGTQYR